MVAPLKVGIAGLGTVGAEVVRLIEQQGRTLSARCGRGVRVVAVAARSKVKKRGLDLRGIAWAKNALDLASDPGIDCFVELMGGSGEPALSAIETVYSHPQANAQCAQFLRAQLAAAKVISTSSTADAVRSVTAEPGAPHAALGNRLAASLYGGHILLEDVDDQAGNQTRFVWLARSAQREAVRALVGGAGEAKTSIVFWGAGDGSAGWLVSCLAELSERGVSLTRIESRPRRIGLGHYMFFADFEGAGEDSAVAAAVEGLRGRCQEVRVLGSYRRS